MSKLRVGPVPWTVELWVCAAAALVGLALVGTQPPPTEAAHITCAATLGPGGVFFLDSDVGPCAGPGPAIMVDSATLILGGFAVLCQSGMLINGIEIQGQGALVIGGTVQSCVHGVAVAGTGQHYVVHVASDGNGSNGFHVESSQNQLIGNTATNNINGFGINATGNRVSGNTASRNVGAGFNILFGSNRMLANTATDNGGDGFEFDGDSNWLKSNVANSNGESGIRISSNSQTNVIIRNTAQGNASFDLDDDNLNCDQNVWLLNTFAAASQACIH